MTPTIIDMRDESGRPYTDEVYVHGHVDHAALTEAVTGWLAEWYDGNDDDAPEVACGPVRHRWGRWSFIGTTDDDGLPARTIAVYSEPGRGRFPITAATSQSELDRRERDAAQEAADVAWILERHPTATITHRYGSSRHYRFTLPELQGDVSVSWVDGKPAASVQQRDLEAWEAYMAAKAS